MVHVGFEDLYHLEYPGLLAVATALLGTFEDGEDLVQDTMVKTFVRWPSVARLDRPGAWCHRVLMNACRSRWRRRQTEQRFWARQPRAKTFVDEPSADVIAFWSVVRAMPLRPRTAVALYYAADRSTSDVAAILGVPEGTVRSDLARARVVLARELGVGHGA